MGLDKFIKDKNDVELSSSLSKDIRRKKGIVYQSDVIDEENELIVQHRLLLKKSYFYRMIFLGEYLLARIFLESLGVGDKKINYLLKKTSALKKDIPFNYLPLINLQDNMRHINEMLKLINDKYMEDNFHNLLLLKQEYLYVASQYLVGHRSINLTFRAQISPVIHMINQSDLSFQARSELSGLLEKIKTNQEYLDSHQDMRLSVSKMDAEIQQDAQLVYQVEKFVETYSSEINPEHLSKIRAYVAEQKIAQAKNDAIFKPILKNLNEQIEKAEAADKEDVDKQLSAIVDLLKVKLSDEQREKIKAPLDSLKENILLFRKASIDEKNICLKQCSHDLEKIMALQPGLPELKIIHDKIEARLILIEPETTLPIFDHTIADQMIGHFRDLVEKKEKAVEITISAKEAVAVIKQSKPADIIEPMKSELIHISEDRRGALIEHIEKYDSIVDEIRESAPEDVVEKVASLLERLEREDYRKISSIDLRKEAVF